MTELNESNSKYKVVITPNYYRQYVYYKKPAFWGLVSTWESIGSISHSYNSEREKFDKELEYIVARHKKSLEPDKVVYL